MKSCELNRIMQKLSFPLNYIKKGSQAYSIIEHKSGAKIMKGFCLSSSINKDCFFLNYFVQPLYIRNQDIDLSLGDRLGGHLNLSDIDRTKEIIDSQTTFLFLNLILITVLTTIVISALLSSTIYCLIIKNQDISLTRLSILKTIKILNGLKKT